MTAVSEFQLFVRDNLNRRVVPIKDFKAAKLAPVFNDVGTWSVTLSGNSAAVPYLIIPGAGLIAARNGHIVLNGPANYRKHTVDAVTDEVTVSGFTDEVWLKRRRAHPSPTESVAPFVQEYDVRTGQASQVIRDYVSYNAASSALGPRQVPFLNVGPEPGLGLTVSAQTRFDDLLVVLQTLATSGKVGFKIEQIDTQLWFQVYAPQNLSGSVKFAVGLKNLSAYSYDSTAPMANMAYIGGTGDGVLRNFTEAVDEPGIAAWGRIEGDMVDARTTTDATQIAQAGTDALTQNTEQASLDITPIERPGYQYGIDYRLGDTVAVLLEGPVVTPYAESNQIIDSLRSVEINLTADGGATVKPFVGTAARGDLSRIFRVLSSMKTRFVNLETRK